MGWVLLATVVALKSAPPTTMAMEKPATASVVVSPDGQLVSEPVEKVGTDLPVPDPNWEPIADTPLVPEDSPQEDDVSILPESVQKTLAEMDAGKFDPVLLSQANLS